MILEISAKVVDTGVYTVSDQRGNVLAEENSYVPDFIEGDHCGDYIYLDIDIDTGQILNWDIDKAKLNKWIRKNKVS